MKNRLRSFASWAESFFPRNANRKMLKELEKAISNATRCSNRKDLVTVEISSALATELQKALNSQVALRLGELWRKKAAELKKLGIDLSIKGQKLQLQRMKPTLS